MLESRSPDRRICVDYYDDRFMKDHRFITSSTIENINEKLRVVNHFKDSWVWLVFRPTMWQLN